jgi:hypothetical protein
VKFIRTVTYEINGHDLHDAHAIWDDEGPETGPGLRTLNVSDLQPAPAEPAARQHRR